MITLYNAAQRCGVTAALDLVDQYGCKSPAAVSAYHVIAILIVALTGWPAYIAGIKRCPDNAVGAFKNKIADSQTAGFVIEMVGLSVIEQADGVSDI